MKTSDDESRPGAYIDYIGNAGRHGRVLNTRFGIRVRDHEKKHLKDAEGQDPA